MKLKVWNEKEEVEEKEVFLRLQQVGNNIYLRAVDKLDIDIGGGILLEIKDDGTINRGGCINEGIGFQLEAGGKVKIVD